MEAYLPSTIAIYASSRTSQYSSIVLGFYQYYAMNSLDSAGSVTHKWVYVNGMDTKSKGHAFTTPIWQ